MSTNMLTIRYRIADDYFWIDLVFGLFFVAWGLEIAFLLFGNGMIWSKPALFPGLLMTAYGSLQLARTVMKRFIGRKGKIACQIDEKGVTWYGHDWTRLWKWRPVMVHSWADTKHVLHASHSLTISQKFSWRMLGKYFKGCVTFPSNVLIYSEIDKAGSQIFKAIRACAPELEILSHAQMAKKLKTSHEQ